MRTDGAHAAEFFSSPPSAAATAETAAIGGQEERRRHFLAVANLGSRERNSYRRSSVLYSFDPERTAGGCPPLEPLQELPTTGATDFLGFSIGGETFLAVSNEQDDVRGGDIESLIWVLGDGGGGGGGGEDEL